MPPIALVLPVALPLVAGGAVILANRLGGGVCRAIAAIGVWAGAAAILGLWLPLRSTLELSLGTLGLGVSVGLRLDAVAVVFGLAILIPIGLLLTLQARSWQESAVIALGAASALLATEASDVVLTALAGCTAATLVVIALGIEDLEAPRPLWAILIAAWLALAWAGVQLQVTGGTAGYAVVPVSALTAPVFLLIAFAAAVGSGLYPWRGWMSRLWTRSSLRTAAIAVALLQPLGLYLLFRAYEMGNGRYPQSILNVAVAVWGVLVAFGAASRAQSAPTRRAYLAEVLPCLAGFAIVFAAVGSTLGLVAALIVLLSASVVVTAIPLVAGRAGAPSLLVAAAGAGMPAGLAFGGLLLGIVAAFEAGDALGLLGLAAVATWLLAAAAAARSVRLPSGAESDEAQARPGIAGVLAAVVLAAGPALGVVFAAGYAAANEVLPSTGPAPGLTAVSTVSTVLPAVALLGPLLVMGAVALASARRVPGTARSEVAPPLFHIPAADVASRSWAAVRSASVPAQYRSLFNARALEGALAAGRPVLWLVAVLALCIAVTR
jgi:hypothetical protein